MTKGSEEEKKPLVVLVSGGRAYANRARVFEVLDAVHAANLRPWAGPIRMIIHGGAPGADALAGAWAHTRRVSCKVYAANWRLLGRRAGPIRNQRMVDVRPDMVLCFPGGVGTKDLSDRAKLAHLWLALIPEEGPWLPAPPPDANLDADKFLGPWPEMPH